MNRILIPTDFSKNARGAFEYAYNLSKGEEVEFYLLNAFEPPNTSGAMLVSLDEILEKEAMSDLKREQAILQKSFPGTTIHVITEYGPLESAVRKVNIDYQIDYVVMGTQGASGVRKVLIGSNTQRVIESVVRPVLAIPEDYKFKPVKKILFATDLKPMDYSFIARQICYIANKFDSHIYILYVETDTRKIDLQKEVAALEMDKLFAKRSHSFHLEECDNVVKGVDHFVDEHNIDMVVMVPKKITFFDRLFKRSVTEQFAFQARTPLLAMKEQEKD